MASGPVACQRVTMLDMALLWERMVHILIIPASTALNSHKQCSTVWCTFQRTLLTFQLPFNCSKGSEMWCVQSSLAWVPRGKASAWCHASKIPPQFLREAIALCSVWTGWLTLWSSGQQVLLSAQLLPPHLIERNSGLISLRDWTARGQFTHALEMTPDVARNVGIKSQFHHFFTSSVRGKKKSL